MSLTKRRETKRARKSPPVNFSFAHPELSGEQLVWSRLSEEEGEEFKALVLRKRAFFNEKAGAKDLTTREVTRYERLLGKAAGDEGLFERKRKEAEFKAERDAISEELRLAVLPKRPVYAETGSVTLPRFVFEWLRDSRDGAFTVADVGMLVALLGMFENQQSLFMGGTFVEKGGELTLVVSEPQMRFAGLRNNDPVNTDHSGYVRERVALGTLVRNKWFEVDGSVGEIRIKLGERAKKIREGA